MKNLSIFFVFLTVIPFSYSQDIEEKLEEPKFYKGDFEKDLEDLINKIEIGTD